ncbi:MAG TPA: hypothetical protein VK470_04485, partial [Bacteroidota bacterium]|nr:hypothetical protein [Bacteroidota bacterium]
MLSISRPSLNERPAISWPEGKRFAFTVFDDTDLATVQNVGPVYEFLEKNGFRTTKSVWPLEGRHSSKFGGSTCGEADYREWVLGLKDRGFEIGLHNATHHSSTREECRAGIEQFSKYFGQPPSVHANHYDCADAIYWGPHRFTGVNRMAYTLLTKGSHSNQFQGHLESSPYFWGDICRERLRYVRDFVFTNINTLGECPYMPYHDNERPYVNRWFASSEGANVDLFVDMISAKNQDQLVREGGACIMYTHFASGFYRGG